MDVNRNLNSVSNHCRSPPACGHKRYMYHKWSTEKNINSKLQASSITADVITTELNHTPKAFGPSSVTCKRHSFTSASTGAFVSCESMSLADWHRLHLCKTPISSCRTQSHKGFEDVEPAFVNLCLVDENGFQLFLKMRVSCGVMRETGHPKFKSYEKN